MSRSRDARALFAGLSIIAVSIVAARGVPLIRRWEGAQLDSARALADRAAAIRAYRADLPALRALRDTQRARLTSLAAGAIRATTDVAASAEVAGRVDDLARAADVAAGGLQVRVDSGRGFRRLAVVRITGVADVAGVARLLRLLADDSALFVARELAVVQAEPFGQPQSPERLRVDLVVDAPFLGRRRPPP